MEAMSSAVSASPPAPPSSAGISPSARISREFAWLIAGSLAGLAAIALILSAVQYHRERAATLRILEASIAERAGMLDALLAAATAPVTALRAAAERAGHGPSAAELAGLARLLPALSNLGFQSEADSGPREAGPRETAQRDTGWSEVYPDRDSDTLRVRYAEPALRDGRQIGVATAEIVLGFLHRAVEMPDYSDQRLVLADRARHVIADSRVGPAQGKATALALGEVLPPSMVPDDAFTAPPAGGPLQFAAQGYAALATPLGAAPWVLVCLVPEGALFLHVVPWLTMTLALLIAVFVVLTGAHFYMSRRFIQPALTLVRLVAAETNGDVLPPQRVPEPWRPLVGRVAAGFAANRAQLADARAEAGRLTLLLSRQSEDSGRSEAELGRLRAEHRSLDAILAEAPALLMVLDREGRIVRFNRQCERVSGVAAERALGRLPWEFLVPPDQSDLMRVQIATALRDDGPISGAIDWLTAKGQPRPLLWSLTAVDDQNGELAFVVAVGLDAATRS